MKRLFSIRFLTLCAGLWAGLSAWAVEPEVVSLTAAGTLESTLGGKVSTVEALKLTGPFNSADIVVMDQKMKKLSYIDRSEAQLVNESGRAASSLPEYAFSMNTRLTYVSLPAGITSTGGNSFYKCSALKEVVFPLSLKEISASSFMSTGLESVTLHEGLETIGLNGFYRCEALTEVALPSTLKSLGDNAFYDTSIESIFLPDNLKTIGANSISSPLLKTIEVSEQNPYWVVKDDILYTKDMTVLSLCPRAKDLKEISVEEGVREIGRGAFYMCDSLMAVELPEGLTRIGNYAFAECHYLVLITFPSTLQTIDTAAFWWCSRLSAIFCYCLTPPELGEEVFTYANPFCTLYVYPEAYDAFMNNYEWEFPLDYMPELGVEQAVASTVRITGLAGAVSVSADKPARMAVYDMTGRMVCEQSVEPGDILVSLPAGVYVVKVGGTIGKVLVK